jgi:RNA polymerase sigma-70 factor (ECF subfamily)
VSMDDEWLANLRRGDAHAYERLVGQFEGPLYRYFLASHGNPQLAGEQSADSFGDLVRALPNMTGTAAQLRMFVFAVARNVLRRSWRRASRTAAGPEAQIERSCPQPLPDASAELREELGRVLKALDELDGETREVFVLRFIEQMSLAEVAEVVGEPLGTVKSRVHRGRQRLEVLLKTAKER